MNTKALCLTTLALLCASTANAQVTSTGYSQPGAACCSDASVAGCNSGCPGSGDACQGWCGNNGCNNGCDNGGKWFGNRPTMGLTRCNSCPMGIGCDSSSCLTKRCGHCGNKQYPDAGWAPPVRLPVNRDGIWYQTWLRQNAYGTPGGGYVGHYPQVYQPTDTTQMGYYYSKVPTWQKRTDRIPPVPRPSAFHTRACPGNCCNGGFAGGCPNGNCQMAASFPSVQPVTTQPVQAVVKAKSNNRTKSVRTASARKKPFFSLTRLTNLFD
jgi:hypothetical protein